MKMAAAEALWETADPAPMSLFTWGNEPERRDVFAVKVPGLLSFLAYNRFTGEVKGIKDLQAEYEARVRPGRLRAARQVDLLDLPRDGRAPGCSMLLLGGVGRLSRRCAGPLRARAGACSPLLVPAIALPYIANSTGWIFTEIGRAPVDRVRPAEDRGRRLAGRHRRARCSSRSSASRCSTPR